MLSGLTSADAVNQKGQRCEVLVEMSKSDGVYGIQGIIGQFNNVSSNSFSPAGEETGYTRFDNRKYKLVSNSETLLHVMSDAGAGCRPSECFFTYRGKKITNLKTELIVNLKTPGLTVLQAAAQGSLQFAFIDDGISRYTECNIQSVRQVYP